MKTLSFDLIEQCTRGIVNLQKNNRGITFIRFPEAILQHYHGQDEGTATRTDCTAGVVIEFRTDAQMIGLKCDLHRAAREFAYIDVYCDGKFVSAMGNSVSCDAIDGKVTLPEGNGKCKVEVYLPHCRTLLLRKFTIPTDSTVEPTKTARPILFLGDSITQGMNSHHPSLTYPAVAGRLLDVPFHNAGVGGDVFNVDSLAEPIVEFPLEITVAYGINDFNKGCDATPAIYYLRRLHELYPETPVTVLEPIWAAREGLDHHPQPNESGITLPQYRQKLRDIVADFDGIRCVSSNQLLPGLDTFVPDGIHPSTVGHQVMAHNLSGLLLR